MNIAYALVLSTAPSRKAAFQIASLLLNKKLAACINISSAVDSLYWWEGKKQKSREHLLFIKTKAARLKELEKAIRQRHPYSVPEIIVLPIRSGSVSYLRWMEQALGKKK